MFFRFCDYEYVCFVIWHFPVRPPETQRLILIVSRELLLICIWLFNVSDLLKIYPFFFPLKLHSKIENVKGQKNRNLLPPLGRLMKFDFLIWLRLSICHVLLWWKSNTLEGFSNLGFFLKDSGFLGFHSGYALFCYNYFNTWCVELDHRWVRNWIHRICTRFW